MFLACGGAVELDMVAYERHARSRISVPMYRSGRYPFQIYFRVKLRHQTRMQRRKDAIVEDAILLEVRGYGSCEEQFPKAGARVYLEFLLVNVGVRGGRARSNDYQPMPEKPRPLLLHL